MTRASVLTLLLVFGLSGGCGGDDDTGTDAGNNNAALCTSGCQASIAASCNNGPTEQAACETDCMNLQNGACSTEYARFQYCADGEAITCSPDGIPIVAACAAEQTNFIACVNN